MKYFICLLMMAFTTSCAKEALPDCGCEGTTYKILDQALAIYSQRVSSEYLITELGPNGYFYTACNPSFMEGKVAKGDTILVSGMTHLNCFKGESLIAQPAHIEVTAVRKK